MSSPPPLFNPMDDSSSQRIASSILTLIAVICTTVIVSTFLCFILRSWFLRRRNQTNVENRDESHVSNREQHRISSRRVSPENQALIDSLPLFTFQSVSGGSTGGDCAVCLSKFEPRDQLRLLPICCHAFHAECVDTWLQSNQTCPLCRSPLFATESEVLSKILESATTGGGDNQSFRIEIGTISRRLEMSDSGNVRRSYSIGSIDYVVENDSELFVASNHVQHFSENTISDKDEAVSTVPKPEQSWIREYMDMISARISVSSRALSFRSSGSFFTGSGRRNSADDLEANRFGEEISEWFRCISGV